MKQFLFFALFICETSLANNELDLNFFLGHWSIDSIDYIGHGNYQKSHSKSHAYLVLDGTAIFDEWRSFNKEGEVVFRGATFRTPMNDKKWKINWLMSHVVGQSVLELEVKDTELEMKGSGNDGFGNFLERARYFNITSESYEFEMSRSYDGGKNWIVPFNTFKATKINPKNK